ncbi:MAG: ribonuclease HIII, partial [Verrucomicrobiota bacterium]|nr:ribonuclease HIII [Verrucomicrobiota bacterium]
MPKKKSQMEEDTGPKLKTIYTIKLNEAQLDQLADYLEAGKKGPWFHYDVAYSLFAFKGYKVNVVVYQSGKLVISGKKTED